jgi:hypothetical protein
MLSARRYLFLPVLVLLAYSAAIAPKFIRNGLDPSVFLAAGDKFVDGSRTIYPIKILKNSDGYDGQFYYRFALAPFDISQPGYGIRIDNPPYRMQRIVYPVLAWLLSAGQPRFTAWAMLFTNLLGLGAIGYFAFRLSEQLQLSRVVPVLVSLWPGFLIALNRSTTEIVAAAFLLATIESYIANRIWLYALLATLTLLTRETSVFIFAGIFCAELLQRKSFHTLAARGLPIAIDEAWRNVLTHLWHRPFLVNGNFTWPLLGLFQAIGAAFALPRLGDATYVLGGIGFIVVFCILVAASNFKRWREPLVFGWFSLLGLMSVLSRAGPWIEPTSFFRAFTECYVIGLFLLPDHIVRRVGPFAIISLAMLWYATIRNLP